MIQQMELFTTCKTFLQFHPWPGEEMHPFPYISGTTVKNSPQRMLGAKVQLVV